MVQLKVLDLLPTIPNQFHNPLPILCHLGHVPRVWRVAIAKRCQNHHWNLVQRNYRNCHIQMCFDLEELNLKVA